jgi:DnaJ-class molecular chaperone
MTTTLALDRGLAHPSIFGRDDHPTSHRDSPRADGPSHGDAPRADHRSHGDAPSAHRASHHRLTLDEVIVGVWEGLSSHHTVTCPVCRGKMAPRYGSGARPVGGRCKRCGTSLG